MTTNLQVTRSDGGRRFRLRGDLDIVSSTGFYETVRPELDRPGDIVLELADLAFIDSSGLFALFRIAGSLEGDLVFESPQEHVERVLGMMRLDGRVTNIRLRRNGREVVPA